MVDHELDELKREFLAEAADKVREMEAALETVRSQEMRSRLAYLAHQLKGSGGSYGYQHISTDAAEIERVVEEAADDELPDASEQAIRSHVLKLRDEIERRSGELL